MESQNSYHVVFKKEPHDFYATGKTFNSDNAISALKEFEILHPNAIFISLCKIDKKGELDNGKENMLQL